MMKEQRRRHKDSEEGIVGVVEEEWKSFPLILNSFSHDIPAIPEFGTTKSFTGLRGSSVSDHKLKSPTIKYWNGVLESFHYDPIYANKSILSIHNWSVSSHACIIWMGHLAWHQSVINYYSSLNLHDFPLLSSSNFQLFLNPLQFYPYPQSSLLSLASRRNNHRQKAIFGVVDSPLPQTRRRNYMCRSYSETIKLPEYLVYYFQRRKHHHQHLQATSSPTVKPTKLSNSASVWNLRSHSNYSLINERLNKTLPVAGGLHNLNSTVSSINSSLIFLNISIEDKANSPITRVSNDLTISNNWTTTINTTQAVNATLHSTRRRRRQLLSKPAYSIPNVFRKRSIMRRNKSSYSFPLKGLLDPLHKLQDFPVLHDDDNIEKQILHYSNDDFSFCNPSIFFIGFHDTNAKYFTRLLTSHPLVMNGFDGWSFSSDELSNHDGCYNVINIDSIIARSNEEDENDPFAEILKEIPLSHYKPENYLAMRSKCYPLIAKNDSLILLDSSLSYNLNPFTPFLIHQVKDEI